MGHARKPPSNLILELRPGCTLKSHTPCMTVFVEFLNLWRRPRLWTRGSCHHEGNRIIKSSTQFKASRAKSVVSVAMLQLTP